MWVWKEIKLLEEWLWMDVGKVLDSIAGLDQVTSNRQSIKNEVHLIKGKCILPTLTISATRLTWQQYVLFNIPSMIRFAGLLQNRI